jgi:hypothetical protein
MIDLSDIDLSPGTLPKKIDGARVLYVPPWS